MPPEIAPGEHSAGASPEQRFLQYARSGDKTIIHSLIMEFADRSYNQARRIVGRNDGADDAVQDAYVCLVSTAKRYDGSIPFAAWLGRLVSSAAINHRRHAKRRIRLSDSSEGAAPMHHHPDETELSEAPEIEALRAALDSLPERYRAPLTLHYFGGLNRDETAQALGATAGTIGSQLFRGLELLREKLARAGFAVTSAGLIAAFAALPTYAASSELKASLVSKLGSSERLLAAARELSGRLTKAKGTALFQGLGIIQIAAVTALIAVAAVILRSKPSPAAPSSGINRSGEQSSKSQERPQIAVPDLVSGLIAHWTFDEKNGVMAGDSSGNGNDGTLVNGPQWISGKNGGALLFDGFDDHVEAPSSASLNSIKGQLTAAAWIFKVRDAEGWESIVGRRQGPQYDELWDLMYSESALDEYQFSLVRPDIGIFLTKGSSGLRDLHTWIHLAGVYDGAQLRLYRNGALVATNPCSGSIADETSPVVIGACDAGTYGMSEWINAAIDDVRIYNRALSYMEVWALAH